MKQTSKTTETKQLTTADVVKELLKMQWRDDAEKYYVLIEKLDEQRRDGSRVTTAREIMIELISMARQTNERIEFTPCISITLEWLYYRRTGRWS
jgi:hypothetical protein